MIRSTDTISGQIIQWLHEQELSCTLQNVSRAAQYVARQNGTRVIKVFPNWRGVGVQFEGYGVTISIPAHALDT